MKKILKLQFTLAPQSKVLSCWLSDTERSWTLMVVEEPMLKVQKHKSHNETCVSLWHFAEVFADSKNQKYDLSYLAHAS